MVRSSGFGSAYHDLNALCGLVFTLTPAFSCLNRGPGYTSRQRILQQVRGRTVFTLPLLVNLRFQGLFHSPSGVLFTFPSRYLFTIGCFGILSLTRWSSQIQRDYACPPYSGYNFKMVPVLDYRTFTFYGAIFQLLHLTSCIFWIVPLPLTLIRFGIFPIRSPLLRELRLLYFPPVTKMFQFTRFAHAYPLCIKGAVSKVSSFGYAEIVTCLRFPQPYRR